MTYDLDRNQFITFLNGIAKSLGGEVKQGYSGRSMYGERCFGITCSSYAEDRVIKGVVLAGLPDPYTDSLGLDTIIYWPNYADIDSSFIIGNS